MRQLLVFKNDDRATVPQRAYGSKAAGLDLFPLESFTLKPGERKLVRTGLIMEIPDGFYGRIAPRSGLAFKHGIDVLAGVIDSDYRGEVGVVLINLGQTEVFFQNGSAVAQIIITPYESCSPLLVDQTTQTERGTNGFGSSSKS